MESVLDLLLGGLEIVYGRPWVAFVALLVMLAWSGVLFWSATQRTRPYLAAANARVAALKAALGQDADPDAERAAFSRNYVEAAKALNAVGGGAEPLVQAWREFHESIVDENDSPIRNTTRPSAFFGRAKPRLSGLLFASNVFVAAGLILTFLGLVVALRTAAENLGDAAQAQGALTVLLTVASAKFLTSIGGIGASLILRFAEHGLAKRVNAATDEICALLERGLLYVPPQRLAVEQLEELRRQTAQLTTFNTDFALQISERMGAQFQQVMTPVATSLSALNESMSGMGASIRESLDGGAAKAVSESAGAELRALGATLANLGEQLAGLGSTVGASGDLAAQQIRQAGADFAEAAKDIRSAFETLVGQVDGVGTRLSSQSEAAAKGMEETLTGALARLEAAQGRSTEQLEGALRALRDAGEQAASTMQRQVADTLATGVAEGQELFRQALDEGGEALRGVAAGLASAVGEAADRIERAAGGFTRSGESAVRAAEQMEGVTGQARQVAVAIGDASKGFASAGAPVAQAATAISEAATRLARTADEGRTAENKALEAFRELAEETAATQAAASQAWAEYRARFEAVDRALGEALQKMRDGLDDALGAQGRFVTEFDAEMAKAVGKLASRLDVVEDQSENLGDVADQLGKTAGALERVAERFGPVLEAAE